MRDGRRNVIIPTAERLDKGDLVPGLTLDNHRVYGSVAAFERPVFDRLRWRHDADGKPITDKHGDPADGYIDDEQHGNGMRYRALIHLAGVQRSDGVGLYGRIRLTGTDERAAEAAAELRKTDAWVRAKAGMAASRILRACGEDDVSWASGVAPPYWLATLRLSLGALAAFHGATLCEVAVVVREATFPETI